MARHAGWVLNWTLLALFGLATLVAFLVLPLWLLPSDPWWGLALVPIVLMSNSFWALHHEAIHGNFHGDRRINNRAGRAMAILLGSSFRVLQFAHLMHHRYNRYRLDRPDIYEPQEGSYAIARFRYYSELFLFLYLSEVAVPLLCLLPKAGVRRILDFVYRHPDPAVREVRTIADRIFLRDRSLNEIRIDAVLTILVVAGAFVLYGPWWPMLLAFLIARGILISFLDNVYHFATPLDRVDFAMNLRLPATLRLVILNMNMHRVHHHNTELPWWQLPAHFRSTGDRFDAGLIGTALLQLTGPVRAPTSIPGTANRA